VRHPLDLKTIKARVKEGRIASASQLRRALSHMFANALIYNRPGTEVHRMATEMRDAAEEVCGERRLHSHRAS
jgi:bromodomain-containing protein 8